MRKLNVSVRWMIRRDMLSVLEIEQGSFDTPWIEADVVNLLRQSNTIGMVAEHNENIVGFVVYSLFKYTIGIERLAVHPKVRLRGVGSQIVDRLASKIHHQRRNRITMLVDETNLGGLHFLKKLGFTAERLVRNPFDDRDVDGIDMHFVAQQEVVA